MVIIIIIIMRQRHGSGSSYGYGQVYIWSQFWFGNINWKITAKLDVFTDCGSSCDHRTSGCGSTDFHNSVQHDQSTICQCFMFQVIQFSFLFVDTSHGDVTPSGDTSHDDVTEPLFSYVCVGGFRFDFILIRRISYLTRRHICPLGLRRTTFSTHLGYVHYHLFAFRRLTRTELYSSRRSAETIVILRLFVR